MLGIGARRAHDHKFLETAVTSGFIDHMKTHGHVLIEKLSGITAVCSDAANGRSQMNQDLGLRVGVQLGRFFTPTKIVVSLSRSENFAGPLLLQTFDNELAQKAAAPGHRNPFPCQEPHSYPSLAESQSDIRASD